MELKCAVQTYAWGMIGSSSAVARLAASGKHVVHVDEETPYAELWMGCHPNGPSRLAKTEQLLSEYIEKHPQVLGEQVEKTFGEKDLPFLLKVLSVNKALSIQVHPDKAAAEKLHASRPDLYKDPNHKPEMAVALTPFSALCGFRPLSEIQDCLQSEHHLRISSHWDQREMQEVFLSCLKPPYPSPTFMPFSWLPELGSVIGEVENEASLERVFRTLMTQEENVISSILTAIQERIQAASPEERIQLRGDLFKELSLEFPGDIGILSSYFLNHILLQPGEALFLGANVPHAYLKGDCVECMACSDNVVRAGLTPKFKDVDTLLSMLDYTFSSVDGCRFIPSHDPSTEGLLYSPPVQDFCVRSFVVSPGSACNVNLPFFFYLPEASDQTTMMCSVCESPFCMKGIPSGSILLVIEGKGCTDSQKSLGPGKAFFLPAGTDLVIQSIDESPLRIISTAANISF
ncbi:unnamed protein product [Darwinula stevensoni]|uniref:Mannose-6-phosphate isomerase n=1 Tax=Darwinula stevensoni TaxID=69355 RepID=A0A7R8XHZ0_9CRUS|nr:unnamed protein product [Darwinula stevensoni]CAG0893905.1 unnamed protein product [Darwinula stevensoni]